MVSFLSPSVPVSHFREERQSRCEFVTGVWSTKSDLTRSGGKSTENLLFSGNI